MRNVVIPILLLIVFAELVTLFVIQKPRQEDKVLSIMVSASPEPEATATDTPSPAPVATPEATATPKPLPTRTPTPVPTFPPQPVFTSQQINEFINRFAAQYSVSPDVLRHVAVCESGFNASAQNLGYAGLYQFGSTTWKNLRKEFGEDPDPNLRLNAEEAVQTAAYAIGIGKGGLWPNCMP